MCLVWLFGNICQHFTFLETATCFTRFFLVKYNVVQYCSNVKWRHLIWATVFQGSPICKQCS